MNFIEELAKGVWNKYGKDFHTLKIVVSSSRIRLFLNEALKKYIDVPSFEPKYVSMDDLVMEYSSLQKPNQIKLLAELFNVYRKYFKNETFDHFYGLGNVLLRDFDMIDRHFIDAAQIFRNISDLKEMDVTFDYLTDEQRRVVSEFWKHFYSGAEFSHSEYKNRFLAIWKHLGDVYAEFQKNLNEKGFGYMGMIYRKVAENILNAKTALKDEKLLFVGFNTISPAERVILGSCLKQNNASFAWDVDKYYIEDKSQEAGFYIRQNVKDFGNLPEITTDNLSKIGSIEIVPCSSDTLSLQHVSTILSKLESEQGTALSKETVIVLPKEELLIPLLYALPEKYSNANVTMGYPFSMSAAYSLLEILLAMQMNIKLIDGKQFFYHEDVEHLFEHPLIRTGNPSLIDSLHKRIVKDRLIRVPTSFFEQYKELEMFRAVDNVPDLFIYLETVMRTLMEQLKPSPDVKIHREALFTASEELASLGNVIWEASVSLSLSLASFLIKKHLSDVTIPFRNEQMTGIQIMGMLETRCLDFRNVIVLSMTDDNYPGRNLSDQSFILPTIRYAFDLPTPESKEAMYGYNFYRLLQRAENVFLVYSSSSDGQSTGERSRYVRQLEMELIPKYEIKSTTRSVGVGINILPSAPIQMQKDERVRKKLLDYTIPGKGELSPSAFSSYLTCPMKFYFSYIAGMKEEKTLEEDLDERMFGNIFHRAAQIIYGTVIGKDDARECLKEIKTDTVKAAVRKAIAIEYFALEDDSSMPALSSELEIINRIICDYLEKNLLRFDAGNENPFKVLALEQHISYSFQFDDAPERKVNFGGRLDRMDLSQEPSGEKLLRIVDYKTGSSENKLSFWMENLLKTVDDGKDVKTQIINTLLYAMMVYHNEEDKNKEKEETDETDVTEGTEGKDKVKDVCPVLYYVKDMRERYNPSIVLKSKAIIEEKLKDVQENVLYSKIATGFENVLRERLKELFDFNTPFRQRRTSHCDKLCPYKEICGECEECEDSKWE